MFVGFDLLLFPGVITMQATMANTAYTSASRAEYAKERALVVAKSEWTLVHSVTYVGNSINSERRYRVNDIDGQFLGYVQVAIV